MSAARSAEPTNTSRNMYMLSHVGIFDRHDRKDSNILSGVADLADAVLRTRPRVSVRPTPRLLSRNVTSERASH